ncbi:hypothetical protein DFH06DRAFT_506221 [Mycena polygramma]|nr:hypothetical protein DFH06DRAFT_506221 [Mycena polygramma]
MDQFPYDSLYYPPPPSGPPADDLSSVDRSFAESDTIDINVEGPLEDSRPAHPKSERMHPDIAVANSPVVYYGPYTRRQDDDMFAHQPSGLQALPQHTHAHGPRSQSFNYNSPAPGSRPRTHSDNTFERPPLTWQFNELEGSAVEDDYSSPIDAPSYGSIPPSPASPLPPWASGTFLFPPDAVTSRLRHASSYSSFTSSASSLEWDGNELVFDREDMGSSFHGDEPRLPPSDGLLHPPMSLAPWGANGELFLPGYRYRHSHASSSGFSETSSIPPSSPNLPWEADSFDFVSPPPSSPLEENTCEDSAGVSPTIYSDDTQRPASRQGEDLPYLTQQFSLQGGAAADGFLGDGDFGSYRQEENAFYPGGRVAQRPPNIATSSSEGYSAEGGISPSRWSGEAVEDKPDIRRQVGTDAGRRAARNRRKDKTTPGAFVCNDCGADFTAKHNLLNHENSHKSVKNFLCDLCGVTFGTKHVLTRHRGKCLKNKSS